MIDPLWRKIIGEVHAQQHYKRSPPASSRASTSIMHGDTRNCRCKSFDISTKCWITSVGQTAPEEGRNPFSNAVWPAEFFQCFMLCSDSHGPPAKILGWKMIMRKVCSCIFGKKKKALRKWKGCNEVQRITFEYNKWESHVNYTWRWCCMLGINLSIKPP